MNCDFRFALMLSLVVCSSNAAAQVDCGDTSLQEDEHQAVRSIYDSCKNAKGVTVSGDAICFNGDIRGLTVLDYRQAISVYRRTQPQHLIFLNGPKYLFINSNGGSASEAAAIGTDLFRDARTVIINENCYSACANYIFTAPPRRILLGKAVVGWHGSPTILDYTYSDDGRMKRDFDSHKNFIKLFSGDYGASIGKLMNEPPEDYPFRGADIKKGTWGYSDEDLCRKFGIRNIIRVPMPQWPR